jgi:hypothetical protein
MLARYKHSSLLLKSARFTSSGQSSMKFIFVTFRKKITAGSSLLALKDLLKTLQLITQIMY